MENPQSKAIFQQEKGNIKKSNNGKGINNRSKVKKNNSPKNCPQQEISYIKNALRIIQSNQCYDTTGKIQIDGDYGDYRMKIFRKKDKTAFYDDPKSLFDSSSLKNEILEYARSGTKSTVHFGDKSNTGPINEEADSILQPAVFGKSDYEPTSPLTSLPSVYRKKNSSPLRRLQRMNSYNGRGENSPRKSPLNPDLVKFNKFPQPFVDELTQKINQIISKPNSLYIEQPKPETPEQEKTMQKGVEQELRQLEGHLYYKSVPEYMAEKWFKVLDNSTVNGNHVEPFPIQKQKPPRVKKPHPKQTHLFRSLEPNCEFSYLTHQLNMTTK